MKCRNHFTWRSTFPHSSSSAMRASSLLLSLSAAGLWVDALRNDWSQVIKGGGNVEGGDILSAGDQERPAGVEIGSKTHRGWSVRREPKTNRRKKTTHIWLNLRVFCPLCNYTASCGHHFIIHLIHYAWRHFFFTSHTRFLSMLESVALKVWMFVATLPAVSHKVCTRRFKKN